MTTELDSISAITSELAELELTKTRLKALRIEKILIAYSDEHITAKAIAKAMGVSDRRIRQIVDDARLLGFANYKNTKGKTDVV